MFDNFYSVNDNKHQFFNLLIELIVECTRCPGKVVVGTSDDAVKTNDFMDFDVTSVLSTNVEEADGRMCSTLLSSAT